MAGVLALSFAAIMIACSDTSKPAGAGGAGSSDAMTGGDRPIGQAGDGSTDAGLVFAPDAADGSVMCPVPALGGADISAQIISGAPPADTGGVISPGTYDLTALEVYNEASAEDDGGGDSGIDGTDRARATIVITTSMMQLAKTAVSPASSGVPISTAYVSKQHVSDVFLVLDDTCPGTDSRQIPFTATPTTITLHSAMVRREVYTLRP
jgi:hypothetical protein